MARKTVRGTVRDIKHGRSAIKRKIQRASPKQRYRRAATKALGHPTTIKGWKNSSRSFYRRNLGCYTVLMMTFGIIAAIIALLVAIL